MENKIKQVLEKFGIKELNDGVCTGTEWFKTEGDVTVSVSPIDNREIAKVKNATLNDYEAVMQKAGEAFKIWREVPAPQRGEIVRQIGLALREAKEDLGFLVSLEMGKIHQEGMGEVQEMIDICDFSVGQSRLLNGFTMHSERKDHRVYDQYHPLGIVGLITSFNFPVAVWAWNSMLAAVCGDVIVWKPSSKTPLCAIATQNIIGGVLKKNNIPEGVFNMIIAKSSVLGDNFVADKRIPLFSITGSTRVGKRACKIIGERLGKSILELGGNNAVIVSKYADLNMAIASTVFGAVGTCGQRCTSTRRIIVHKKVYNEVKYNLISAYEQIREKIGNPLNAETLVGPLVDESAVNAFLNAIEEVKKEGGKVLYGGYKIEDENNISGNYVVPALVEAENHYKIVQEETFAPILYLIKYDGEIEEAIAINNDVPQGLSSSIFTLNMREAEKFLADAGSDCGLANVNSGTSGAEIGGAFGGEKDTGSGRESGSDSWKQYMRRQTNTINYSNELPLAQGIKFEF
ncbi:MAG TPA: aldehyde dehydrogenase family protein [Bacteroidales bacterium]|nr:aldehyde dehydrogenase family protein [Bacteroidales bacterium]HOH84035.1 aldehyde dehydrogenase family protein [Bacteroidales bacterium]HPB24185.1 aldehyde dehydrogenase family protein [Bacteroidales bacterium]HPI30911.1 aldehyde dehydrogenase family protein [Bacteroidales bacterium]HQN14782.1 aldehyde dehydrogenase family protein [Bacteroidales bacterium]